MMKRLIVATLAALWVLPAGAEFDGPGYSVPFPASNGATATASSVGRFSHVVNVVDDFGALGDTVRHSCAVSITSGQANLTVGSGCSFTSADVGKNIVVPYAGAMLSGGKINSIAVTAAGSAYTAIPTINLAGISNGFGAILQPNMQLATATVVTGGSGCTNGSQTFTVSGGSFTSQATFTGTVSGNTLSGSLTPSVAGSYSVLPSTSAASVSGGGCATAPTISSTWSLLSVSNPIMQLSTATVVTGGSGCTNGSQTFTVSGGSFATAAKFTGTVSGNSLSGTLTPTATLGSYTALPDTTSATVTGGGCSVAPTISSTWSQLSNSITVPGGNYPTSVTASVSAGTATVGNPSVSPVATPLTTTISAFTDSTHVTLTANASQTLAAQTEWVTWGHDDSTAMNAAAVAAATRNISLYIPASPNGVGYYYGMASALTMNPGQQILKIEGAGAYNSQLLALGLMTGLLYEGNTFSRGGAVQDVAFDGNTLAPAVYLGCPTNLVTTRANFLNGPQYGKTAVVGYPGVSGCVQTHLTDGTLVQSFGTYYSQVSAWDDMPAIGLEINETDSFTTNMNVVGSLQYGVHVGSGAYNTSIIHVHNWNNVTPLPGTNFQLDAYTSLYDPICGGFNHACVDINASGVRVWGGYLQAPLSTTTSYGVVIEASIANCSVIGMNYAQTMSTSNIVNVLSPQGTVPCVVTGIPGSANALNPLPVLPNNDPNSFAFGAGALANQTGVNQYNSAWGQYALNAITTGIYNTSFGPFSCERAIATSQNSCFGPFSGYNGRGNNSAFFGYDAGKGSGTFSGSDNIGFGTNALLNILGVGASNTAVGSSAGSSVTNGSSNTIIGYAVASTTLSTGSNNILIGTSSSVDTVGAATANEINVGGLLFYNNASVAAPAVTSCGNTPSIDGHANNKSGTVTVGSGTIATCTITFAGSGYSSWNHCRVTSQTAETSFAYSYTKTVLTVTATSLTSDKIDYDCDGY